MKHIHVGGIALFIVAVLCGAVYIGQSMTASSTSNVTIGAVLPLTGKAAYWGLPAQKGIEMAMSEIRAEYGEDAIAVVVEDGQSDAKASASAAQKLLSVNAVDALYSELSGPSSAIAPITAQAQVPFMYGAFNQKIVEENERAVKVFLSFEDVCAQYGVYAKRTGVTKISIFNQVVDAAQYCARGLQMSYPEAVVTIEDNITGEDFRTILLKAKQDKVDVIIPIMYEAGAHALIRQKYDLRVGATLFCDKQNCATENILKSNSPAHMNGVVYFEAVITDAFTEKFLAKHGQDSMDEVQAAAFAYESIWAYFLALRSCANDAACAVEALANADGPQKALQNDYFSSRMLYTKLQFTLLDNGKKVELDL